jgi:hypothetical protein
VTTRARPEAPGARVAARARGLRDHHGSAGEGEENIGEREAALEMLARRRARRPATLGADNGYDTKESIADLRGPEVTPHIAQNTSKRGGSIIDGRTTLHPGYEMSQRMRKRIEEVFAWARSTAECARRDSAALI